MPSKPTNVWVLAVFLNETDQCDRMVMCPEVSIFFLFSATDTPTVAAFARSPHQVGCNSWERVMMEDLCTYEQAGTRFSLSWKLLAVRLVLERRKLFSTDICAADVAPDRHSSSEDAFLCAAAASSWSHDAWLGGRQRIVRAVCCPEDVTMMCAQFFVKSTTPKSFVLTS